MHKNPYRRKFPEAFRKKAEILFQRSQREFQLHNKVSIKFSTKVIQKPGLSMKMKDKNSITRTHWGYTFQGVEFT
jgi:hypothetical protein